MLNTLKDQLHQQELNIKIFFVRTHCGSSMDTAWVYSTYRVFSLGEHRIVSISFSFSVHRHQVTTGLCHLLAEG